MSDLAVLLVAAVPLSLLRGFVLATLWAWFVVPTFVAPTLAIPVAIGLTLVVGLFGSMKASDDEPVGKAVLRGFIYPLVALALGAFWQLFA